MKKLLYTTLIYFWILPFRLFSQHGVLDNQFGLSGRVITDWGSQYDYDITKSVLTQADGKIVLGGSIYYNGHTYFGLIRYQTNGLIDSTFGNQGKIIDRFGYADADCYDLCLDANGRIMAAGVGYPQSGESDFIIVRYNTDGSKDLNFGNEGIVFDNLASNIFNNGSFFTELALQTDGKIVCAGGVDGAAALVRFNSNGTYDYSFGNNGSVIMSGSNPFEGFIDIKIQSDAKILAVGFTSSISQTTSSVLRFLPDGNPDISFHLPAVIESKLLVNLCKVQPNGKIILAGLIEQDLGLCRLENDGSIDLTFGIDGFAQVDVHGNLDKPSAIELAENGKIIIAGSTSYYDSSFFVVCFNPSGNLDTFFGNQGKTITNWNAYHTEGTDMALDTAGNIFVAGHYFNGDTDDFILAKYKFDAELPNFNVSSSAINTYPNPLMGNWLNLAYTLDNESVVTVELVNNAGLMVAILSQNEKKTKGIHIDKLQIPHLANGYYFLILRTGKQKWITKISI